MFNASFVIHAEVILVLAGVYIASLVAGFDGNLFAGALIAQCANTGAKAAVQAVTT